MTLYHLRSSAVSAFQTVFQEAWSNEQPACTPWLVAKYNAGLVNVQSSYLVVWQKLGSKSQPLWPWLKRLRRRIFVEHLGRITDAQPSSCLETDRIAQAVQTILLPAQLATYLLQGPSGGNDVVNFSHASSQSATLQKRVEVPVTVAGLRRSC